MARVRAQDVAAALMCASVGTAFGVRWEPAPCDLLAGAAILMGLPSILMAVRGLPPVLRLSLGALGVANIIGLAGPAPFRVSARFLGITMYLMLSALLIYGLQIAKGEGFRRRIVGALLAAGSVTAVTVWADFLAMLLGLSRGALFTTGERPMGLFKDPNVAASFLVVPALVASSRLLETDRRLRPRDWGLYLFLLGAVYHPVSRSAVLAWGTGYISLLVLSNASMRRKAMHALVTGLSIGLVLPALYLGNPTVAANGQRVFPHINIIRGAVNAATVHLGDRPAHTRTVGIGLPIFPYDIGGRLFAWRAAVSIWRTHLVTGAGPGSFEVLSEEIEARLGATVITRSAHSTYLRTLAENGGLGLTALAVLLAVSFRGLRKRGLGSGDAGLRAALVGLVVNGLFIDTMHFRHLWIVWALLVPVGGLRRESAPRLGGVFFT